MGLLLSSNEIIGEAREGAFMDSPVGPLWIGADAAGITEISFRDSGSNIFFTPPTEIQNPHLKMCMEELTEYFAGERQEFTVSLNAQGTTFQKRVWTGLRCIPHGQTRCYSDIAGGLGQATASRAVGMANSKNPIAIVVPCHRVIGKDGRLVGYAGGLERKKKLLDLEQVRL